jgi:hypothetical protein
VRVLSEFLILLVRRVLTRVLAVTQAAFRSLAERGILLDQYYALTHPSQPNYMATMGGSFFGLADDNIHDVPEE